MGCGVLPAFVGGPGFLVGVGPVHGEGGAFPISPTSCGRKVPSSLVVCCSGSVLRGRAICSEGLVGDCAFLIPCILSSSVGSRDMSPASSLSVTWMFVGRDMICGAVEGEVTLPCSSIEPWMAGFRSVFTGSLMPTDAPSRRTGEEYVEPVRAVSSGSVPWWDFSFTAVAVGVISDGVSCGEAFFMVWLNARRRISTPASNLECGTTGVTGGPNGFPGGVPIVIVSMDFGWDHLCSCRAFGEDLSPFRFFVLGGSYNFAASRDSPALGILG